MTPGQWNAGPRRQRRRANRPPVALAMPILVLASALVAGCRQDMHDQPKLKAFQKSTFFDDGRASRPLVDGTVARGHLDDDVFLHTGRVDGQLVTMLPFPATRAVLDRGHERFDAFCSPCHGRVGDGDGMIVERGLRRPPSLHEERLRSAPDGYFFDVITNGFGIMLNYAQQVPVNDRWAIVAYIRALQLSQGTPVANLPAEDRAQVERSASAGSSGPGPRPNGNGAHGGHP